MNLNNYYQLFSKHNLPNGAKIFLFDETYFALEKDESLQVFRFNGKTWEEMVVFYKSAYDYLNVFESGYIVTAHEGKANVFYLGKLCHSFHYCHTYQGVYPFLVFIKNTVMFSDVLTHKTDFLFMGSFGTTARELAQIYLRLKDDDDITNVAKSDAGNLYFKINRDNKILSFVLYPLEKLSKTYGVIELPKDTLTVEFLKNGNFIAHFGNSQGVCLYDFKGKPLLSSSQENGIFVLQDGYHCVYEDALIVSPTGKFVDEYRNELAVSRDGYKIYAYTIDYGSKKGFWSGGAFKLFELTPDSDVFCFENNNRLYLVLLSELSSFPVPVSCDSLYRTRIKNALGL